MITDSINAANSNLLPNLNNNSNNRTEQDMFMTLLVAQLKNQDPLQPQEGTEFVAQLAQFNSLDNLIGIRQSIEQLTSLIQQAQSQTGPAVQK
ncbi:MAG: flagellar hook capping FlgD N-terminal domain-containing protein [Pyrinomonadaceae bacterium]